MNWVCQKKNYYLYCLVKNQQILFILKDKMEFLIALVSKNKSWFSEWSKNKLTNIEYLLWTKHHIKLLHGWSN